jgi:hypothetical protein
MEELQENINEVSHASTEQTIYETKKDCIWTDKHFKYV